ncbi:glycosyltransferase [Ideonella sp. DXS29W]|uniref:Glycosyltransferase n=1 Tax=Ideonella lacteola TaxID=2984193 RepID=A0ABU9BXS9_9BURK
MHAHPFPAVDGDLPGLLRRLHGQAGDGGDASDTLRAIGPRAKAMPTLVGAMCIGGAGLARRLLSHAYPGSIADEQTGALLEAFNQVLMPAADTTDPAEHEQRAAQWLIDSFGLDAPTAAVFDIVRAGLLIDLGPSSELPVAIKGAMDLEQWALALRGLERQRSEMKERTPRGCFGRAAMCLHRLGRFEEADRWVRTGLGEKQAALITIPPLQTEAELLARWGHVDRPVISIICTTYNHERYIDSAIRGFLSQVCEYPFEILIHDDASTDRTQEVVRGWQQRYPNIIKPLLQTVNQKSQGVRPFETMLARAQGDFVATCEGDDFWIDAGKLQRQVGFLIANPDFSCTTHNYHHFVESSLTVKPWRRAAQDFVMTRRQLMGVRWLLWLPTLVFRKTFSVLPPERSLAAFGDQFLTSYLGTWGRGMYFETLFAAVRRENEFSTWSPLPEAEKERRRVKTWLAMVRLHQRLGHAHAVDEMMAKVIASPLDSMVKAALIHDTASHDPAATSAAAPVSTSPTHFAAA